MEIDWSDFKNDPESYVTCKCDTVFRSHVKLIKLEEGFRHCTQKPCPCCGKNDNARRSSDSPWEVIKLDSKDVGHIDHKGNII
jgi:hypothetical protein